MSLTTRMDILDLVITCLKEHEKELDDLINRLTKAVNISERLALR